MHTLWIWLVLSEALFAVLLLVVWSLRRTEQALVWWALASASLALGGLAISLRGQLPDLLSIAVGNTLFSLSWALRWAGLRQFAGLRRRLAACLAPPLLLGLAYQFRGMLGLDPGDRVILTAALGGGYALLMTVDALRSQHDEPLVMRRLVIAIGVLAVLLEAAVIGLVATGAEGTQYLSQSAINASVLLGLLSLFSLYDLGCFLMVFERHERKLVRDATVDSLTNVLNRAGFSDLAGRQAQRSRRDRRPAAVLVMDLDHFKRVNDSHGHEAGDAVLRAFAQAARAALRPTDLLARPGGEEFWALLPQADLDEAGRSAQRVCDRFREVRVPFEGQQIAATVSVGVAEVDLAQETVQAAIARADRALYDAKQGGRDRVVAAGPPARPLR